MDDTTRMKMVSDGILDSLTGIFTTKGFYEATRELIDSNKDTTFVILYWNIKKFKIVNNLFGYETGDMILKNIADSLKEEFGNEKATFGRLERDNFVCCIPENMVKSGKWKRLGDNVFNIRNSEYHFYLCCGLYKITDTSADIVTICDRARVAMETIKDNYVVSYVWYEDKMWDDLMEEHTLINDFNDAIRKREFKVYYQPVCLADDGKIISTEALVRWKKDDGTIISPGKFIPVFEKNGMIGALDRYVWEDVCRMISDRLKKRKIVVPVAINVSRVEFYNKHLCDDIYNITKKYDVPARYVRIEITESAYSDNPEQVLEAVEKLHKYGFVVLMDDFGSGYSSLNILKDLPIDGLKIDMKFMDGFGKSEKSAIILEAVIRMAKWMKLKTVAEGVETSQEWEYLKSVECDFVQGFHFYKPMPEEDFVKILDERGTKKNIFDSELYIDSLKSDILSQGNTKESMLFYSMIGGMGVLELMGDTLEIVQVNKGYYEVLYGEDYEAHYNEKATNKKIEGEAKALFIKYCKKAKEKNHSQQFEVHYKRDDGKYVWLRIKVKYCGNHGKRLLYYFTLDNIDDIKLQEQDKYLFDYSAALLNIYDKVYRLDFEDGKAEVLHTRGNDSMKVGDRKDFFGFFERFADYIEWIDNKDAKNVIVNKERLDKELEKSKDGNYSASYRVVGTDKSVKVAEVTVLFFKVKLKSGRDEYICCLKNVYKS